MSLAFFALFFVCANAQAWLTADPDDDEVDPKRLRADIPIAVKSTHFNVINYVNSERGPTECNIGAYVWPAGLELGLVNGSFVSVAHVNSVRAAVRQMYIDRYGAGWSCTAQFPSSTPGGTLCETAAAGDQVLKQHINDIRHAFGATFDTPNVCDLHPNVPSDCGNGAADAGEQCDDSNLVNGDGCSATCQCEYAWVDETCGGPTNTECPMSQMLQNGTSTSAQCAPTTQCVANATCVGDGYEIKFDEKDMEVCAFDSMIFKVHATIVSAMTPVNVIMTVNTYVSPSPGWSEPLVEPLPWPYEAGGLFKYKFWWPGVPDGSDHVKVRVEARMKDTVTGEYVGNTAQVDIIWEPWTCDNVCVCSDYEEQGCGGEGYCAPDQMMMFRDCNSGGAYEFSSCKEKYCKDPADSPICKYPPDCSSCTPWVDYYCGGWICGANQMKRVRNCDASLMLAGCIVRECKTEAESPECTLCGNGSCDVADGETNATCPSDCP